MPVAMVLVVQIQSETSSILSYSEHVWDNSVLAFFSFCLHPFKFWAANCCLFIKLILSVSKFYQKKKKKKNVMFYHKISVM